MNDHCCSPRRDGASTPSAASAPDMADGEPFPDPVDVPGGAFLMGSDDPIAYPGDGEGPVREVEVAAFSIAATAVTNEQFARFAEATGHVTDAERYGDSLVFVGLLPPDAPPTRAVAAAPWWRQVPGASWRAPYGPGSGVDERPDHPVVHVSQRDALAYATWVGARLPTETEWEVAARGGLVQQPYPWGSEREPGGVARMKTFEGTFPDRPTKPVGTVPVDAYGPNGLGLFNTTGNVWEWTTSPVVPGAGQLVLRGGSYLCHESYCRRYRVSARSGNTPDTSLGHTGFRVVRD